MVLGKGDYFIFGNEAVSSNFPAVCLRFAELL